jgi:hypothetical protein
MLVSIGSVDRIGYLKLIDGTGIRCVGMEPLIST